MSKTGRFYEIDFFNFKGANTTLSSGKITKVVEPIKKHPKRGGDWTNGGIQQPINGAIKPEDSIITKENGFDEIIFKDVGDSPNY